jgi:hypothetical protein
MHLGASIMTSSLKEKLIDIRYEEIEDNLTKNQVNWRLNKVGVTYEEYRKKFPRLMSDKHGFKRDGFEKRLIISLILLTLGCLTLIFIGNKLLGTFLDEKF